MIFFMCLTLFEKSFSSFKHSKTKIISLMLVYNNKYCELNVFWRFENDNTLVNDI